MDFAISNADANTLDATKILPLRMLSNKCGLITETPIPYAFLFVLPLRSANIGSVNITLLPASIPKPTAPWTVDFAISNAEANIAPVANTVPLPICVIIDSVKGVKPIP